MLSWYPIFILIFIFLFPHSILALEYTKTTTDNNIVITMRGAIEPGDFHRFGLFIKKLPRTALVSAIILDSSGGNVREALKFSKMINTFDNVAVDVIQNNVCSSACFLLFAAAKHKAVYVGASIGVHSAAIDGEENLDSYGMTMKMARAAAKYHVPEAIIGKMVITPNKGEPAWLTADDLKTMGVDIRNEPKGKE